MSEVTNLDVKFLDAVSAGVTTDVAERIHHLAGNGEWQEDQEIEAQVSKEEGITRAQLKILRNWQRPMEVEERKEVLTNTINRVNRIISAGKSGWTSEQLTSVNAIVAKSQTYLNSL